VNFYIRKTPSADQNLSSKNITITDAGYAAATHITT
jgi:hypothetical protein